MGYDFKPEGHRGRGATSALRLVLALLVGWFFVAGGPARAMSTTTVSAATYTYDAPAAVRAGAQPFTPATATSTQLSG